MRGSSLLLLLVVLLALPASGAAAQAPDGGITFIHGLEGQGGAPIDIYVNGELALESFAFGRISESLELPADTHQIEIYPSGEEPGSRLPLLASDVDLGGGANATIVANVTEDGRPTLSVFVNDTSPIRSGNARVTIRHGAAAPSVDVLVGGAVLIEDLANGDNQALEVPEGDYDIALVPTGEDGPVVFEAQLSLDEGQSYAVHGIGSVEGGSFTVALQVIGGLQAPPAGVPTGSGGLAADGFPAALAMVLGAASLLMVGAGIRLARGRRALN